MLWYVMLCFVYNIYTYIVTRLDMKQLTYLSLAPAKVGPAELDQCMFG